MKVLADQAKDATNQVRAILGDVQRGINTSVMLTEEAVKRAIAGKERTEVTQRTIGEITHRFQESVQTFQQIVASTNQQQLGIEQVMGALAEHPSGQPADGGGHAAAQRRCGQPLTACPISCSAFPRDTSSSAAGDGGRMADIRELLLAAFEVEYREHVRGDPRRAGPCAQRR